MGGGGEGPQGPALFHMDGPSNLQVPLPDTPGCPTEVFNTIKLHRKNIFVNMCKYFCRLNLSWAVAGPKGTHI